jgi:hypothetical protein
LPKEAVLSIFWILRIVRPMSEDGGNGHSRVPILSFPPNLTRAYKELPDMKRALFSVMTLVVLAVLTGCAAQHGRHPVLTSNDACNSGNCNAAAAEGCQGNGAACENSCDNARPSLRDRLNNLCGCRGKERCEQASQEAAGPANGAVTYPYYTVRGPRDYLAKNPQSIGP